VSADPWVLGTDLWDSNVRSAYLGNGYLGQRFALTGTGLSGAEKAAGYLAGNYREESLQPLSPLLPLQIRAGAAVFGADAAHLKPYHQELRLREGTLLTRGTWDTGAGPAEVEIETALLRQQPDLALARVRISNQGRSPVQVLIPEDAYPAPGTKRSTDRVVYTADGVTLENSLTDLGHPEAVTLSYEVAPGQKGEFALVTRVQGGPIKLRGALETLPRVESAQVDRWLEGHRQAWGRLWERDIEIEGDAEAQQVVRACLFQLLSSTRDESGTGVPPMGLSGNAFSGHVFWDMDSWMLPALLPQHPELARAMLEYRYRTLEGARANAAKEKLPGASYAWESGSTGREALQGGEFVHGRHVSGDIALALKQYYTATGDREWLKSRAWPILKATADNWVARAQPDGSGGLTFKQVTTPDELAGRVDQSAWTQHVARVNLEFATEAAGVAGQAADPKWLQTAKKLGYLRDPQTKLILPYAGFKETTKAKQADLLLVAFPGEEKLGQEELAKTYDYYVPKVIANGPAMTDAVHAVVAARLGRDDEALKRFRESYRPFVRPPYHVFSEKRSRDNLAFHTGAAGVVEAVVYGFGGLHPEADASQPDRPRLEPHVPAEWKTLRLHGVQWRGKSWDVELKPGAAPAWQPHASSGK
jgi:trehalose/maltose hydrolase-like predicted phosphorylase